MIAQFAEHKALVLAYEDLLEAGVPSAAIQVRFSQTTDESQPQEEHRSFLERLRAWVSAQRGSGSGRGGEVVQPTSPLFESMGGTLEVNAPQFEAIVVDTIVRHYGELVG